MVKIKIVVYVSILPMHHNITRLISFSATPTPFSKPRVFPSPRILSYISLHPLKPNSSTIFTFGSFLIFCFLFHISHRNLPHQGFKEKELENLLALDFAEVMLLYHECFFNYGGSTSRLFQNIAQENQVVVVVMGKRSNIVVLSSDDEENNRSLSSNRSYSKPKSRSLITRSNPNPRVAKKARISGSRSRLSKQSSNVDEVYTTFMICKLLYGYLLCSQMINLCIS